MNVLSRNNLGKLLQKLSDNGYIIIGPRHEEGAIIYDEIKSIDDLPAGWTDEQDAGKYRLKRRKDNALFGYIISPHSWKKYLFPPRLNLWNAERSGKSFEIKPLNSRPPKYAFLGVRSCELNAVMIQDKVFSNGSFTDSYYSKVRNNSIIIAVNCTHAGKTCFCVSMATGPRAKRGFDIALTEIINDKEHYFTLETGSKEGEELITGIPLEEAGAAESEKADKAVQNAQLKMGKLMDTTGIKDLLYNNPDNPQWIETAKKCLTCANCTMVCPTCFCSNIEDVTNLKGKHAERWRSWDSCFSLNYSKVAGGNFRTSPAARYRQWITHKLASWIDQFGTSGCVGCGRGITWCPGGIDITDEVKKLRGTIKI